MQLPLEAYNVTCVRSTVWRWCSTVKHPDCQRGICPLCMTAGHRDHSVVNIAEQRKVIQKSRASVLMKRLGVEKKSTNWYADRVCDQQRLELVQKLKQAQDVLEKDFEVKIKVIDENMKKLAKICSDKNGDLTKDDQFMDTLQKQSEDKERMKYMFYNLTETAREMEPPGEANVKHSERKQPIIEGNDSLFVIVRDYDTIFLNFWKTSLLLIFGPLMPLFGSFVDV